MPKIGYSKQYMPIILNFYKMQPSCRIIISIKQKAICQIAAASIIWHLAAILQQHALPGGHSQRGKAALRQFQRRHTRA